MTFFKKSSRFFDSKPYTVQLYVTDRCNLACSYCNEYTVGATDPPLEVLKARMRKLRELGALRVNFLGGEPLIHPDIVEVVRYAKAIGFINCGMSTNAFVLTKDLLHRLEEAGLNSCQVSVDRMTPNKGTQKSLKTILHKLDWFSDTRISMTVTGVLSQDTIDETKQVIHTCLDRGVPVAARLVHDDLVFDRRHSRDVPGQALIALLEYQRELKARGERIHSSWRELEYQLAALRGQTINWTCLAGYKFFCVSGSGQFWPCSQMRTERQIMDMTPEDLLQYNCKKDCQEGCGVYCIIATSMMFNHPIRGVVDELREARLDRRARTRTRQLHQ